MDEQRGHFAPGRRPVCALTIGGSDSGGGAGIQADLKTFAALGVHGMSVVTAITAQNSVGVQGIHMVPAGMVALQMDSVLSDIGADAVKTGMLGSAETIAAVAEKCRQYQIRSLVVDPVMVAASGDPLIEDDAVATLIEALFPLATVVTPNMPEAEALVGFPVSGLEAMEQAARAIARMGPRAVVVKGGHLEDQAVDVFYDGERTCTLASPRVATANAHGTGCTFASALAAELAKGAPLAVAVRTAKEFVTIALQGGYSLGAGPGTGNPMAWLRRGGNKVVQNGLD